MVILNLRIIWCRRLRSGTTATFGDRLNGGSARSVRFHREQPLDRHDGDASGLGNLAQTLPFISEFDELGLLHHLSWSAQPNAVGTGQVEARPDATGGPDNLHLRQGCDHADNGVAKTADGIYELLLEAAVFHSVGGELVQDGERF